jgi:EAL domain-containing protein (putative c-di-GMP-specific phosphodiesterase class I)
MLEEDTSLALPASSKHTASVGLAMFEEDSEASATDLIIAADRALYEAKHRGGNAVVVYEAGLDAGGLPGPLPNWAGHIRSAIAEDGFLLYGQPVVDLRTDAASQCEILLRLPTPEGEVLLPDTFFYTAERHGFARELDRWVISHALPTVSTGLARDVAINLAADSVADPDLGEFVRAQLAAHDVDPGQVIFEITETAAIANMEGARRCLSTLIGLGCRVALDDFGAGFGSFYHLKHLQLQFLKVDGEFIRTLLASKTDQLMVRHIVEIAHGLGQQAVAEHVEDELTLQMVRELDFDLAQGNFLAQAAPLNLASWAVPAVSARDEAAPSRTSHA